MDIRIKFHFLMAAVWLLATLCAFSINRIKYSYGKCCYFYQSGYVKLSVKLPRVLSFLLFLYPYKRPVAVSAVVMTSVTYILFIIYHVLNKFYVEFNDMCVSVLWWIEISVAIICLLEVFIDSTFNTKKAEMRLDGNNIM